MSKIFNNPYSGTAEVWSLQGASIYLNDSTTDDTSILGAVENITVSYGRQVDTRYPIGSNSKPIKLIGPPRGTIQIQTVFGPKADVDKFLSLFGSNCKTFSMTIKFSKKTGKGFEDCDVQQQKQQSLTCTGCLGNSLSYTLSSQAAMVMATGSFTIEFDGLEWS